MERDRDRLAGEHQSFIRSDLYEYRQQSVLKELDEMKESLKWAFRLALTTLLGLVVTLVVVIVSAASGAH